jgi:hypothetical protein
MNIATRKNDRLNGAGNSKMLPVLLESKTTPNPWLLWATARMIAKTTMPRTSKNTPVLLTIATIFTP